MANYVDITVLVDRSGSMTNIKKAMESGFDEFVNGHKALPTTRLTLIQFDSQNPYQVDCEARPILDAPRLSIDPRGMTPLLDSLRMAIDNTGNRLRQMAPESRPDKVLFVIITDGQENASIRTTKPQIKDMITRQNRDYNWQFVYLGANQDAIAEAAKYGINQDMAITFSADAFDTRYKMRGMTANTLCYASSAGTDIKKLAFDNDQRKQATTEADVDKLDPARLP